MNLLEPGPIQVHDRQRTRAASGRAPFIGVVTGRSRQGRLGDVPAHWLYRMAEKREDLRIELIDLGDLPLPFLEASSAVAPATEPAHAADRWFSVFERLDGLIVVLPGGGKPCARASIETTLLTQALSRKPVAFVTFGADSADTLQGRLSDLAARLGMVPIARSVGLSSHEVTSIRDMQRVFDDFPHLGRTAEAMLDELCAKVRALNERRTEQRLAMRSPVRRIRSFAGIHHVQPRAQ